MAITSTSTSISTRPSATRTPRRAARRVAPPMTAREFDAYLLARDTLRRLRDAGWQAAVDPPASRTDQRA